jgi:hypothetical protein
VAISRRNVNETMAIMRILHELTCKLAFEGAKQPCVKRSKEPLSPGVGLGFSKITIFLRLFGVIRMSNND